MTYRCPKCNGQDLTADLPAAWTYDSGRNDWVLEEIPEEMYPLEDDPMRCRDYDCCHEGAASEFYIEEEDAA